jgi:hypothetical protein
MDWLCWHVGTVTDPKFTAVMKRCGVSRPCVLAMWAYLLERARVAGEGGAFGKIDSEDASIATGVDEGEVVRILNAFDDKGLISGGAIANWDKRQHKTSTERVKKHRDEKKQSVTHETDETVSSVSPVTRNAETDETAQTDRQTYIQTKREGASASPPPTPRGSRLQPDFEPDMEIKTALIAERPDLDYSRVIEGFRDYWLSQPGAKGVKLDWNRTFRKWWREQRAQTGPKAAKFDSGHAPTSFSDTPWRLRLKGYHESNFWLPSFGPKPGEPGCEVPKKFLDEFSSLNRLKGAA